MGCFFLSHKSSSHWHRAGADCPVVLLVLGPAEYCCVSMLCHMALPGHTLPMGIQLKIKTSACEACGNKSENSCYKRYLQKKMELFDPNTILVLDYIPQYYGCH